MPSRVIREGILESERVDRLSIGAEVFYRRAMSKVDDAGRYYAKPELLLAALFPLRIGRITTAEIATWLGECVKARLVRLYTIDTKDFLEIIDFRQQVRSKSKFPDPPPLAEQPPSKRAADATQVRGNGKADAHLFASFEVEVENGSKRGSCARAVQATSTEFEEAWARYPKREGGNPKRAAWKAWSARIAGGATPSDLLDGVLRYAKFIRARGDEGSRFVKQAATFLGPEEHFREPWSAPEGGNPPPNGSIERGSML